MNSFIVNLNKLWEYVHVTVRIFIGQVFVDFIRNRTLNPLSDGALHIRISTYLKLNVLMCQHALKIFIKKVLYLYLPTLKSAP